MVDALEVGGGPDVLHVVEALHHPTRPVVVLEAAHRRQHWTGALILEIVQIN